MRVGAANVYLVGDAGGQVKMTTVGGTVTGLYGARAAAEAIEREAVYHHLLWPTHRELTLHWLIRRAWNRFGEEDYAALLRAMNGRLRRLLEARNRDCWWGALLPALAARPTLLGLAVKSAKTFRAPGGDKGVAVTVWTADLQQKAGKRSAA